ncbi:tripartite tricarboxylate transporter substrate binding protein [Verminephrobacter aporrectodeae]|uniref:tripartite tricarboxylate transporter substrate binding protein n=1 Tax=Verminephrobacter aporrectodeae TaxID=1110389 RepID=UPI002243A648|nr:tripartite tricarboxylate transporter substrate binding protein [Verminephrobacter aporrectodeae]MCW8175943.1 tripartite tricarboxylate transporter substrate binding protein [Verminephrobacter aporrectodeae subsp. tuberculatae]MCW8203642.1 tripartite tricarboxylate transporter substrate binding protein [Verminephrobacter aporrectodeae subsp. tuberculatae]
MQATRLGRDFAFVTPMLRNYFFFVVVPAASPWRTTGDLLRAARDKPAVVNYGSWFVGSPGHLGAAMLEAASGTRMTHVPYKEMTQLYTGVGNGEVHWAFGSAASAGAMQRAGRVRYIAVAAPARVAGFADVPTVAESGGPAQFELSAWVGLLAPKGTPRAVIDRIQQDVAAVAAERELQARYATLFYEPYSLTPEQFARQVAADAQRFGETIRRLDIRLD